MIIYDLNCDNNHKFEGWFSSADEFDRQQSSHSVQCPTCGSSLVRKVPSINHIKPVVEEKQEASIISREELYSKVMEIMLENCEDVGEAFAEEAYRMHYMEAPERSICGTATLDEVRELHAEGIEVIALPIKQQNKLH